MFQACDICGANLWTPVYKGPIRAGAFGSTLDHAIIARCSGCNSDRLAEDFCLEDEDYESDAYRRHLQQSLDIEAQIANDHPLAELALKTATPDSLEQLTVADVGCSAGSLLDLLDGKAKELIAIEPASLFHDSLRERGYTVFSFAADASRERSASADLAFSTQVIEHVSDPVGFLRDIQGLLKPGGTLWISTPNRDDVLMDLLPDDFPSFFYRRAHRWYFDRRSLSVCAEKAGYRVVETRFVHRHGMSNTLLWIRDGRPPGQSRLDGMPEEVDHRWQSLLEHEGQSDLLFLRLRKDAP